MINSNYSITKWTNTQNVRCFKAESTYSFFYIYLFLPILMIYFVTTPNNYERKRVPICHFTGRKN